MNTRAKIASNLMRRTGVHDHQEMGACAKLKKVGEDRKRDRRDRGSKQGSVNEKQPL